MKQLFYLSALLLMFVACKSQNEFEVTGHIKGAADETLYLDATKVSGTEVCDSVKLNKAGFFTLKSRRPQNPEIYALRLGNQRIFLAVDSTEVITVSADKEHYTSDYTVKGSVESSRIQELNNEKETLRHKLDSTLQVAKNLHQSQREFSSAVNQLISNYKDRISKDYIFANPQVISSYYALFQEVNGFMLFDPANNKRDLNCFRAVATSMQQYHPHSDRTKNLVNIAIKSMKHKRVEEMMQQDQSKQDLTIPADKVRETGFIDITLRDVDNNKVSLSSLKGKVVLLDFTAYAADNSPAHILALRDLYKQYSSRGLEIYQISYDQDRHFWRTSADNLPWVCVRDPYGAHSTIARTYNVSQLPTFFLLDRNLEIKKRDIEVRDIEAEIKKLLR